jgi:hypothetical protein
VKICDTVAGDEQEDKRRPERGRYEWPDAIPKGIAKNPTKETWDIGGHIEVAVIFSGDDETQAAEEGKKTAKIQDASLLQGETVEGRQYEVHLDLIGKAPKDEQVRNDDTRSNNIRSTPSVDGNVQNQDQGNAENGEWIDSEEAADIKAQSNPIRGMRKAFERVHEYKTGMNKKGNDTRTPDVTGKFDSRNVMKACTENERRDQMLEQDTANREGAKDIQVGTMPRRLHKTTVASHSAFV